MFNRLADARDLVEKIGNKNALHLIFSTAKACDAELDDRIQAIGMLEELGYRQTSLVLLREVVKLTSEDDLWILDLLLRFGEMGEVRRRLEAAISSCTEDNRDFIATHLAELRATEVLVKLNAKQIPLAPK